MSTYAYIVIILMFLTLIFSVSRFHVTSVQELSTLYYLMPLHYTEHAVYKTVNRFYAILFDTCSLTIISCESKHTQTLSVIT